MIAADVGSRVAGRFRERSKWYIQRGPLARRTGWKEEVPLHNTWLLMRDRLTHCDFYYNGDTAESTWQIGEQHLRNGDVLVKDMRPPKLNKGKDIVIPGKGTMQQRKEAEEKERERQRRKREKKRRKTETKLRASAAKYAAQVAAAANVAGVEPKKALHATEPKEAGGGEPATSSSERVLGIEVRRG